MDDTFEKLRKDGKNGVDNLIKWMQDSKLLETTKEAEFKARKLFDDVKDQKDIQLAKFKEVVTKLAEEQKKSIDDATKMLNEAIPKLMNALQAGLQAAQEALGQSSK